MLETGREVERSAKTFIYRISPWRETDESDQLKSCRLIHYASPSPRIKQATRALVLTRCDIVSDET